MKYTNTFTFKNSTQCRFANEKIKEKFGRMQHWFRIERLEIEIRPESQYIDEIIDIIFKFEGRQCP